MMMMTMTTMMTTIPRRSRTRAATGAEFVTCNGEGTEWDNPPPEAGGAAKQNLHPWRSETLNSLY